MRKVEPSDEPSEEVRTEISSMHAVHITIDMYSLTEEVGLVVVEKNSDSVGGKAMKCRKKEKRAGMKGSAELHRSPRHE